MEKECYTGFPLSEEKVFEKFILKSEADESAMVSCLSVFSFSTNRPDSACTNNCVV